MNKNLFHKLEKLFLFALGCSLPFQCCLQSGFTEGELAAHSENQAKLAETPTASGGNEGETAAKPKEAGGELEAYKKNGAEKNQGNLPAPDAVETDQKKGAASDNKDKTEDDKKKDSGQNDGSGGGAAPAAQPASQDPQVKEEAPDGNPTPKKDGSFIFDKSMFLFH